MAECGATNGEVVVTKSLRPGWVEWAGVRWNLTSVVNKPDKSMGGRPCAPASAHAQAEATR